MPRLDQPTRQPDRARRIEHHDSGDSLATIDHETDGLAIISVSRCRFPAVAAHDQVGGGNAIPPCQSGRAPPVVREPPATYISLRAIKWSIRACGPPMRRCGWPMR